MDEFSSVLKNQTGLVFTPDEVNKLFHHYFNSGTCSVDYAQLYRDIKEGLADSEESTVGITPRGGAFKGSKQKVVDIRSYDQIMQLLNDAVEVKANNLPGQNHTKKLYSMLSSNHSPKSTKSQLKKACSARFGLEMTDRDIDEIFKKLDCQNTGTILIKNLISDIAKKKERTGDEFLSVVSDTPITSPRPMHRGGHYEDARLSYDNKIMNLTAPNASNCRVYSVWELEHLIHDKIYDLRSSSDNAAKAANKLFSSGGRHFGDPQISWDQLCYTLWQKMRLEVSERDIERLFQKYQQGGVIYMSNLMDGVIRRLEEQEEQPLLEDHPRAHTHSATDAEPPHGSPSNSFEHFFSLLR
jgi:hypothetical protein